MIAEWEALYHDPFFLGLTLPLFAIAVSALLAIPRRMGFDRPSRLTTVLVVLLTLILVPFMPVRGLLLFSLWTIAVVTTAAVVFAFLFFTPWGRRAAFVPLVRSRMRGIQAAPFELVHVRMPRNLNGRVEQLRQLGFELVQEGRHSTGRVMAILVRPPGTLAIAVRPNQRTEPDIIVQLASVVSTGTKGVYSTQNVGLLLDQDPPGPIISDIYPYARPDVLLGHHLAGRRELESRQIRFGEIDAEDAVRLTEAIDRIEISAILDASSRHLSTMRRVSRPLSLTEVLSDPAYGPVLASMRGEVEPATGPARDVRGSGRVDSSRTRRPGRV